MVDYSMLCFSRNGLATRAASDVMVEIQKEKNKKQPNKQTIAKLHEKYLMSAMFGSIYNR